MKRLDLKSPLKMKKKEVIKMNLTLRINVACTSCYADRMVDIKFYQIEGKTEIKWEDFKCHMCGFDQFVAMPKFETRSEKEG